MQDSKLQPRLKAQLCPDVEDSMPASLHYERQSKNRPQNIAEAEFCGLGECAVCRLRLHGD